MAERVSVVGLHGGAWYGARAERALRDADVIVGAARQLEAITPAGLPGRQVVLHPPLDDVVERCAREAGAGRRVCVLAAGDPGFFGIARLLGARLGPAALDIHPAPSSVALAFARTGHTWDDAVVATCHGRPVEAAAAAVLGAPKAAVLVGPDAPPHALGAALVAAGCGPRHVWVCTDLGADDERITATDLEGLAGGRFDPMSVVVLVAPGSAVAEGAGLAWGLDESAFDHRAGMITKAEVRAVALGKLSLPRGGVLWDVGAGSGSVAVEAARLAPGLRVFAIERDHGACGHIRANSHGTAVTVVPGEAPAALDPLPDPDRAFVGGGGLPVLDAVLARLRPGGRVVATSVTLATAVAAADRLGALVQIGVSRAVPVGRDGALRLAAENPVFVAWGPPCGS